ncbi:MAG TPA: SRPBCC family protein [Usitatibacteraceae bacterium]
MDKPFQNSGSTADREIATSRIFDAPREQVFRMWIDPAHIGKWWGPKGFTTTTLSIDVRVGGAWRFVMHGPDGTDYPNLIVFKEVVKPERLVYVHAGESEDEPGVFQTTVTFEELDGKTRLSMRALFPSAAERDRVIREHGAIDGMNSTLDRLAAYLAQS